MKPRLLRLGGEFFWVTLGQGLVALGGLLGVRLLTEVLPPAVYGELALAMTIVAFVQVTVQQPLFESVRRFFHAASNAGEAPAFLQTMWRFARRISVGLVAGGLVVSLLLVAAGQGSWIGLWAAVLAVCLISTWNLALGGIQSATRRRAIVAGHEGLQQWLRFGLAAALVWWAGPHSSMAMTGYAMAAGLVVASQGWFLRGTLWRVPLDSAEPRPALARAWEGRLLAYAWPFGVWGAALSVQAASARWSLQQFEAAEAVGLFAVLYQVGHYPVALLMGGLSKFLAPVIFSRAGAGEDAGRVGEARRISRFLVASAVSLTLLATAVAALAHEQVFALLVAPEYRGVSWLLPLQVLGSGLFAASQAASMQSMLAANTRALLTPKIASASIGTVLNVLAAWRYGLPGVLYAGVLYGAISFLWIVRARSTFPRQPFP